MCSPLGDSILGDDDDFICVSYGRQAVSDRDGSPVFGQLFQTLLDPAFALIIQGTGCFVQDEDGRIFQKDTGDRDTLLLSSGKAGAAFSHEGIIAVRSSSMKS